MGEVRGAPNHLVTVWGIDSKPVRVNIPGLSVDGGQSVPEGQHRNLSAKTEHESILQNHEPAGLLLVRSPEYSLKILDLAHLEIQ